jgi:hypothetical protein
MFIVLTVFCLWLGWQVETVRQRKQIRDYVSQHGGDVLTYADWDRATTPRGAASAPSPQISLVPPWRRWLGDEAIRYLGFNAGAPPEMLHKARKLFPECAEEPYELSAFPFPPPTTPADESSTPRGESGTLH